MTRELIILVPGLARVTRGSQLTRFVDGLTATSERMVLTPVADDSIVPHGVRRLRGTRNGTRVEIDVCEAFWNDLVPSLTQEQLWTKVARGFSLIWFWARPRLFLHLTRRWLLTIGVGLSAIAFIAWYLGVVVLAVEALSAADLPAPLDGIVDGANAVTARMGGLWFFVGASAVVGFFPVNLFVDISDFAKRYIANEPSIEDGPAVRFEIVRRVREQLLAAIEQESYDSVTVVGHSFGSLVAVDVMADLPEPDRFRMVTLGSLIEFLGLRADWLEGEVEALSKRPELDEWIDVTATEDWLAGGAALPESDRCREVAVTSFGTLPDMFFARVHARYYDNQEAVRLMLRTSA